MWVAAAAWYNGFMGVCAMILYMCGVVGYGVMLYVVCVLWCCMYAVVKCVCDISAEVGHSPHS